MRRWMQSFLDQQYIYIWQKVHYQWNPTWQINAIRIAECKIHNDGQIGRLELLPWDKVAVLETSRCKGASGSRLFFSFSGNFDKKSHFKVLMEFQLFPFTSFSFSLFNNGVFSSIAHPTNTKTKGRKKQKTILNWRISTFFTTPRSFSEDQKEI